MLDELSNQALRLENFPTILLVAAVALIDGNGRVLMQKRAAGKAHGGLWEFPGGKLEPGETPQETAIREIGEELALAIEPGSLEPVCFAAGREPQGEVVILLYSTRQWRGRAMCHDGEEIAWFLADQLAGLAKPLLDYPLAEALLARLEAGRAQARD